LLSRGLTRWLGCKESETCLNREEFAAFTDLACKEGVLDRNESSVLRNVMRFSELRGADVMTPRTVLLAYDESLTVSEVAEAEDLPFSRIPVYREQIDQITGYVLKQDLLLARSRNEEHRALSELKREIVAMHQDTRLPDVLDAILRHREHLVLLVDDFGGCSGIVTMEDVVETLLGIEIVDETDQTVDMQALARRKWDQRQHARQGVRLDAG
jgi:CBS domain containing-hemolysin-like protein